MRAISLRYKLMGIFLLTAALVGGASFYGLSTARQTQELLFDIINNDFQRINTLQQIKIVVAETEENILAQNLGLTKTPKVTQSPAEAKRELTQLMEKYRSIEGDEVTEQNQQIFAKLERETKLIVNDAARLESLPVGSPERPALLTRLDTTHNSINNDLDVLIDGEQQSIRNENSEVDQIAAQLNLFAWISSIGALLIATLLGFITTQSMVRRIGRLRQAANDIASGNLAKSLPVTSHDELGEVAIGFNDMTARLKESYARLALEKQRDETLIESMGEGVVALNTDGRIVFINTLARQLLELNDTVDVIDQQLSHLAPLYTQANHAVTPSKFPSYLTLKSGRAVSDFFVQHTKEKQKRILSFAANPIVLEDKVAGAIVVLRDVTKEREVDRMKTEFISLASHQLRTPLSAIKWFSEMLMSGDAGKLKADQLEFVQNISASTERMIELVASLLNISRIESGRIMVAPEPTDLHELVSGIVNDLKAKTEEKKQVLIISVHSDLPQIKLDPRLIGQVYLNLLTNAIKYTPKGGEISVFISKRGKEVISQVTDNGYGIPKSQQDRVFQKFFRAENVAKHETDGTGLGLYLIKAVIESSGGKIWFESEEGKGTTFWFSLPLSGMKAKEGEVTLDV